MRVHATLERGTQSDTERDEPQAEHDETDRHRDARRGPDRGEIADRVVDRRVAAGHGPGHRPRGHERDRAHHAAESKEPITYLHVDQSTAAGRVDDGGVLGLVEPDVCAAREFDLRD